jgi:hypothetical protein
MVAASGRRRAAARISRSSATLDMTALTRTKRLCVSRAMASAMLVLPQPGGP